MYIGIHSERSRSGSLSGCRNRGKERGRAL